MSDKKPELYIDEKWDKVIDVTLKHSVTGLVIGAIGGLLLFRSPSSRTATATFGMGVGVGSAYQVCDKEFKDIFLPK